MRALRVAVFALGVGVLCACANPRPSGTGTPTPSPTAATSPSLPPLKFSGHGTAARPVRWVQQTSDNRKQYELLARSYESDGPTGGARGIFDDVRVTFYGVRGTTLQASAPQAIIDQSANTITLVKGVVATSNSGMRLQCDTLTYSRLKGMIYGEGHVVATGPHGLRASGNRLDSDISLTHTRMQ